MLKTRQSTWSLSCSRAPMWTQNDGEEAQRPLLNLVLDETMGLVVHLELTSEPFDAAGLVKFLERAQRSPNGKGVTLGKLVVEEHVPELAAYARKRGFPVVLGRPSVLRAQVVAGLAEDFEMKYFGRRRDALVEKLGPELTMAVFQTAARFWEVRPWERVLNSQVVLTDQDRVLSVLGSGGEEFGVVSYASVEKVKAIYDGMVVGSEASLLFGSEFHVSFTDLDFYKGPQPPDGEWPLLLAGLDGQAPEPREVRILLASVLALCDLELTEEWQEAHGIRLKLGPALSPGEITEHQVEHFIREWPKQNAAARKIGRVLLEFLQTQEPRPELERHCQRLGGLWSERVSRFSLKNLRTEGLCEEAYRARYKPSAAEWKRLQSDWKLLEKHLK